MTFDAENSKRFEDFLAKQGVNIDIDKVWSWIRDFSNERYHEGREHMKAYAAQERREGQIEVLDGCITLTGDGEMTHYNCKCKLKELQNEQQ